MKQEDECECADHDLISEFSYSAIGVVRHKHFVLLEVYTR
jgi:hypothetical protein